MPCLEKCAHGWRGVPAAFPEWRALKGVPLRGVPAAFPCVACLRRALSGVQDESESDDEKVRSSPHKPDLWWIHRGLRPSSLDPYPNIWVWKKRKFYERCHRIIPIMHDQYFEYAVTGVLPDRVSRVPVQKRPLFVRKEHQQQRKRRFVDGSG